MSEYLTPETFRMCMDMIRNDNRRARTFAVSRAEREMILDILNWCDGCEAESPCLCEQKEWEMEQAINDAEGEAREEWPENWGEQ